MRWEDERYVRVYTRDTAEWLALSWDGQALLMQLLRKVDRAGVLELGRLGKRAVAVVISQVAIWEERLAGALEELLVDGCVELHGSQLVIPNFIEAQETPQSDRARQRAHREKARDVARDDGKITERDRAITDRDGESQNVTESHAPSRAVTPCHALSLRAVPSVPSVPSVPPVPSDREGAEAAPAIDEAPAAKASTAKAAKQQPLAGTDARVTKHDADARALLDELNLARKRANPRATGLRSTPTNLAGILERLREGNTVDECRRVIAVCEAECKADEKQFEWFDAVTPFVAKNFARKVARDPQLVGRSPGNGAKPANRGSVRANANDFTRSGVQ